MRSFSSLSGDSRERREDVGPLYFAIAVWRTFPMRFSMRSANKIQAYLLVLSSSSPWPARSSWLLVAVFVMNQVRSFAL